MSQVAINSIRWMSADLDLLAADEWKRYEIIDGELFVTRAPHIGHQDAAGRIYAGLLLWSEETGLGKPFMTPGVIFSDADNVLPDVIWISKERLAVSVDDEGHLTAAPELIVEVLSAGGTNERRDRSPTVCTAFQALPGNVIQGVQPRVLTLYPLAPKTSCKKCVACFWAKVPEAGTLGKTKNNTNNFPKNPRKMHKVNSLGSASRYPLRQSLPKEHYKVEPCNEG